MYTDFVISMQNQIRHARTQSQRNRIWFAHHVAVSQKGMSTGEEVITTKVVPHSLTA